MMVGSTTRIGLAVLALAIFVAGAIVLSRPNAPGFVGVDGMEAALPIDGLADLADVVVVGQVVSTSVRPFTSNPDVPAADRDPLVYARGSFHDVRIDVLDYLKGSGPLELSVRLLASTPQLEVIKDEAHHWAKPGARYVLFLERSRGPYTGGFNVLGSRGIAPVVGDRVRSEAFGDLLITEVRELITGPSGGPSTP